MFLANLPRSLFFFNPLGIASKWKICAHHPFNLSHDGQFELQPALRITWCGTPPSPNCSIFFFFLNCDRFLKYGNDYVERESTHRDVLLIWNFCVKADLLYSFNTVLWWSRPWVVAQIPPTSGAFVTLRYVIENLWRTFNGSHHPLRRLSTAQRTS